jgi:hypothetical protein
MLFAILVLFYHNILWLEIVMSSSRAVHNIEGIYQLTDGHECEARVDGGVVFKVFF